MLIYTSVQICVLFQQFCLINIICHSYQFNFLAVLCKVAQSWASQMQLNIKKNKPTEGHVQSNQRSCAGCVHSLKLFMSSGSGSKFSGISILMWKWCKHKCVKWNIGWWMWIWPYKPTLYGSARYKLVLSLVSAEFLLKKTHEILSEYSLGFHKALIPVFSY